MKFLFHLFINGYIIRFQWYRVKTCMFGTQPTQPPPPLPPPKKMSNRDPLIFTKSRFCDYETPHNSETLALCRWDPL